MALSLGVSVGSRIFIGDDILRVIAMPSATILEVSVKGKRFTVTDNERKEVLPDVFVSAGFGDGNTNRLVFEAPRRIPIHRENRES